MRSPSNSPRNNSGRRMLATRRHINARSSAARTRVELRNPHAGCPPSGSSVLPSSNHEHPTHITSPYPPKNALSIIASPMIGPAAPAKRNFDPSVFHKVASPGLTCATRGISGAGAEREEEGAVEREPAPTREEGTRAVWSRTLRTSRLSQWG